MKSRTLKLGCLYLALAGLSETHAAIDTGEFTYRGQLKLNHVPVNDVCDFEFSLWKHSDSTLPEDQVGSVLSFDGLGGNPGPIDVVNGLFYAILDFGPTAFSDDSRWMEVAVRCPSGAGAYSTLSPRDRITGVPYAIRTRGVFVDENGLVGLGTENPAEMLEVAGNFALVADGFDPHIELRSDDTGGGGTSMLLRSRDRVGFTVEDDRKIPRFVVHPNGDIGMGTTAPEAPLHVRGAGRFRGNHLAFFQSEGTGSADGIAIQLINPHTNRSNNYLTFYNGDEIVTGRIEGFDLESGDWVPPPALPPINLTIDPNIDYNPDWFEPGVLPSVTFSPGTLPTASLNAGTLPALSFSAGTLPSLSFSQGTLPSLVFNRGTLPTLNFTQGTLPSHMFDEGELPSLSINFFSGSFSFDTGESPSATFSTGTLPTASLAGGVLPTATFNAGTLPTANFNPSTLPTANFTPGTLPSLSFSGGTLPALSFNPGLLPSIDEPPFDIGVPAFSFTAPTLADLADRYCWTVEQGVHDFMPLDPVSLAIEGLKSQVAAKCKDEGVTYGSKGADYAEWLPKLNPEDRFQFAQIVGVHGGKVSLKTEGAEQIMAVSRAPVVVGNVPPEGDKDRYVTVGFMGQLPVVVRGRVRPGDYIIPSGREDGTATAVAPDKVEIEHLGRTLGRAWSASENDIYGLINVVIGLNGNEVRPILERQREQLAEQSRRHLTLATENARLSRQLEALEGQLAGLMESMKKLERTVKGTGVDGSELAASAASR